jgi:hypothetical protein
VAQVVLAEVVLELDLVQALLVLVQLTQGEAVVALTLTLHLLQQVLMAAQV